MNTKHSLRLSMLAVALALASGQALAVDNGTIASGTGSIAHNGATTTIQQSSDKLIVNWNNFDIAQGQTVNINQPGATSAILNRVMGGQGATSINGALNANGRVFVVNPNGVVVGQTGVINAAGVVLSALNISDADFINGGALTAGAAGASVQNAGSITANGGDVVLIGPQVVNQQTGKISVSNGSAALTAASGALLGQNAAVIAGNYATPVGNALVANDGTINVTDGSINLVSAYSTGDAREVLRNTGTLSASGIAPDIYDRSQRTNGSINLTALHAKVEPKDSSGYHEFYTSTDKSVTGYGATNVGGTLTGNSISVNASEVVNLLNGVKMTASFKPGRHPFFGTPQGSALDGGLIGIYGGSINQLGAADLYSEGKIYRSIWTNMGY